MTAVFVILGVVLGGVIGQLSGLFFGGFIGFLVGRNQELRRRLDNLEKTQAWFEGAQTWFERAQSWYEGAQTPPPAGTVEQQAAADRRGEAQAPPAETAGPEGLVSSAPGAQALSPSSPWVSEGPQTSSPASPWVSEGVRVPTASPREEAQTGPPAAPQVATAAAEPAPDLPAAPTEARATHSRRAPSPAPAAAADPLTRFAEAAKTWVLTGNAPVKVGVLVSLIGLGLLIREANERGLIRLTVEMILIAITAFGLVLLAAGWRLRGLRPVYGLSLQGGGIAVLYLTTYAAFAVYDVLAAAPAAAAVVAVTVGAGVLAVSQDSRTLALLGILGGFLAPVLAYTRPEDHVWVFSFYAVLNAAIVAVAWFKVWPEINLAGLGLTFGISAYWLLERHTTDDWASVQPFIALFVVMYAAIPVLFAARQAPDLKDVRTAPLVFGAPFMGFGLQALVVGHTEYGLAVSALALALIHGVQAAVVRKLGEGRRELTEAYIGLGVTFAAIAVPFALSAYFTATVWALQGLMLFWAGVRRAHLLAVVGGAVLQALAGSSLGSHLSESLPYPPGAPVIANEYLLGAALLAAAGLASGWLLHRSGDRLPGRVAADEWAALIWGAGWWLGGGLMEIGYQVTVGKLAAALVFAALSFGAAGLSARRLRWPNLGALGPLILPAMAAALYASLILWDHPLDRYGWAAWPVTLAVYYAFLRRREAEFPKLQTALHAGGWWVLAVLIGVEVFWLTDQSADDPWPLAVTAAALLLGVGATLRGLRRLRWPLGAHRRGYLVACAGPMMVLLTALAAAAVVLSPGDFSPLPHLPLLNPLGLLVALLLAVAFAWRGQAAAEEDHLLKAPAEAPWAPALAVGGAVLATMEAVRTVHHWLDVPFEGEALFDSTELQVTLSILWAVMALSAMVVGVRSARRAVWVAGASFMGVVVLKLFLVDLSNQNAVGRVVSFIVVGVLLLIVGYFAPVPPPQSAKAADE